MLTLNLTLGLPTIYAVAAFLALVIASIRTVNFSRTVNRNIATVSGAKNLKAAEQSINRPAIEVMGTALILSVTVGGIAAAGFIPGLIALGFYLSASNRIEARKSELRTAYAQRVAQTA